MTNSHLNISSYLLFELENWKNTPENTVEEVQATFEPVKYHV